jgi:hypothetical protein
MNYIFVCSKVVDFYHGNQWIHREIREEYRKTDQVIRMLIIIATKFDLYEN